MKSAFSKYDHFIAEVQSRDPDFFAQNHLVLSVESLVSALAEGEPDLSATGLLSLAQGILAHWQEQGVQFAPPAEGENAMSPVVRELLGAVRDVAMLERSTSVPDADIAHILATQFTCVADEADKPLAYVRNEGNTPLLLLNALGIPLRIWGQLLSGKHDYKIIVPAVSSCDPVDGGMLSNESVQALATQLQCLLERLALPVVHVLAWCNAGRIGLQLLSLSDARIGQLILLAPTLRGGDYDGSGNPFEDNLDRLFGMVRSSHKRARAVAAMLGQTPALPDWKTLPDAATREHVLLGLPRRKFAGDLTKPMAEPVSLIYYVERTDADEVISTNFAAQVPAERITLVQGENDSVVHNLQARWWLQQRVGACPVYQVSGAGHYIQDLQYPYLIQLLDKLLLGAQGKLPCRISSIQ